MFLRKGFVCLYGLAAFAAAASAFAAAPGFDPDGATRAYLNLLSPAEKVLSDTYFEGRQWMVLWGALVALVSDWLILNFAFCGRLARRVKAATSRRWLQDWMTGAGYLLAGAILTLPWQFYAGHWREQRYGLSHQGFWEWFGGHALETAFVIAFTAIGIAAIFAAIRKFAQLWWLVSSGIFIVVAAITVMAAPVYIDPLINTYAELPEGPVRERILSMAHAQGVPASKVYHQDASRQTSRISASVSGLGPTVRISLNDNLLDQASEAEIAAVMGHELGHYVLGHKWRLLVVIGLLTGVAFFLMARILPRIIARHGSRWGISGIGDPESMPLFGMAITLTMLASTPVLNTIVRLNEHAADAFGLDVAREPDGAARIALRLSQYRKIEPGWLEEALLHDHPSGATRVRRAMEWKARHMGARGPAQ